MRMNPDRVFLVRDLDRPDLVLMHKYANSRYINGKNGDMKI